MISNTENVVKENTVHVISLLVVGLQFVFVFCCQLRDV